MAFKLAETTLFASSLNDLPNHTLLITTLNAHSYNVARTDAAFAAALQNSDILIPDGISVVWAKKLLSRTAETQFFSSRNKNRNSKMQRIASQNQDSRYVNLKKIAGEDLFYWEMKRLDNRAKNQDSRQEEKERAKAFFLGSTEEVLAKIRERAGVEFPNVEIHTYSPPYKPEFTEEDNKAMIAAIQAVNPDVLFVGMTAPKQEKWAYWLVHSGQWTVDSRVASRKSVVGSRQSGVGSKENIEEEVSNEKETTNYKLQTINYKLPTNCHVCCIGAVFDFYAGTVNRAPRWIIRIGLEWFYRLVKEPKRMWRRYLIGNVKFIFSILGEILTS